VLIHRVTTNRTTREYGLHFKRILSLSWAACDRRRPPPCLSKQQRDQDGGVRRPAFSSSFFYSVWCCSTNVPLSYVAEVQGIRKVNRAELEQRLKLMMNEALAESLAAMSPSTTG
jgi:hypothetical protein